MVNNQLITIVVTPGQLNSLMWISGQNNRYIFLVQCATMIVLRLILNYLNKKILPVIKA